MLSSSRNRWPWRGRMTTYAIVCFRVHRWADECRVHRWTVTYLAYLTFLRHLRNRQLLDHCQTMDVLASDVTLCHQDKIPSFWWNFPDATKDENLEQPPTSCHRSPPHDYSTPLSYKRLSAICMYAYLYPCHPNIREHWEKVNQSTNRLATIGVCIYSGLASHTLGWRCSISLILHI